MDQGRFSPYIVRHLRFAPGMTGLRRVLKTEILGLQMSVFLFCQGLAIKQQIDSFVVKPHNFGRERYMPTLLVCAGT